MPRPNAAARAKRVEIDMGGVAQLDTFGAWLLERLTRNFSSRGCDTKVIGLKEDYRALMAELHGIKSEQAAALRGGNSLVHTVAAVGEGVASVGATFIAFVNMLGALTVALARVVARPRTFRFTSMVHQLDNVGWRAVPIILLITFLIGAHHRPAGHLPLPQVRRRHLRRRHGRHPGAARDRRADRRDHGGGPLRLAPTPPSSAR